MRPRYESARDQTVRLRSRQRSQTRLRGQDSIAPLPPSQPSPESFTSPNRVFDRARSRWLIGIMPFAIWLPSRYAVFIDEVKKQAAGQQRQPIASATTSSVCSTVLNTATGRTAPGPRSTAPAQDGLAPWRRFKACGLQRHPTDKPQIRRIRYRSTCRTKPRTALDQTDFHLIEQPWLGTCTSSGIMSPSSTASSEARSSAPVTLIAFFGRDSSNWPR